MKNLWKEFKEFAFTGNVIDMAVGVILGGALKDVVTALVNMLMGIISGIIKIPASLDEAVTKIPVGAVGTVSIKWGAFVASFINFVLLALCIFAMVKAINGAKNAIKLEEKKEAVEEEKASPEVELLTEIRDLLKNQK
ncbi:large-conductance mechanosensitive channel [Intestinibaculum porci]|uniref:Large-conductance mechanosensitive channel n=1 Tax=Intestinibaculum porci TaxID=2487118 RepID=A0A3G9JP19_9FIRM|nr:large conductance mechanosensitive channel protein MscL [Intestinibaculum porci]BBH27761.1 large-conductance mechanosensitive channel [Intestinibaculum porci]